MKINKYLLTLILLSVSLIFGNSTLLFANTNNNQTQNTTQRVLDAIPSPDATGSISFSDYISENQNIIKSVNLNKDSYIIPHLSKVLDQGTYPGCVSFALRSIKETLSLNNNNPDRDFSNAFIYSYRYGNYTGSGMFSTSALQGLKVFGSCYFETFPDNGDYEELHAKITQPMIDEAKNNRIDNYIKLNSDEQIKTAIQTISAIYVTFPVYSNFMNSSSPDGIIPNPDYNSTYFGNHSGVLVGYSYDVVPGKLYYLEQNSWGKDWNSPMKGYCWLSADFPFREAYALVDSNESKLPPDPLSKIKKLDITSELNATKVFSGDSLQLSAIADNNYKTEEYVTDKAEWSVSDTSIATIDNNGLLIANSIGKVKITAKHLNKTDTKYITIVDTDKYYSVQVLSTKIENDAEKLVDELINKRFDYDIFVNQIGRYYKVTIGNFADKNEANDVRRIMKNQWEFKNAKVVFIREDV